MKSKIQFKAPTAILMILLIPLALATAQSVPQPGAPAINNATGLPVTPGMPAIDPRTGLPVPAGRPAVNPYNSYNSYQVYPPTPTPYSPYRPHYPEPNIDPNTGLPLPTPEPQWIGTNWPDPNTVIAKVAYDNLPLSEVVKDLRAQFKDQFDVLPMPTVAGHDCGEMSIRLELNHVKASEIFNAMNLVFENDRTPVRWELRMNGSRPVAQLRVLPEAAPKPETHRTVYFVGNLLGDEKSGGTTMEQLVKTLTEMWPSDLGKSEDVIQFHKEAQLLVANGTPEQLEFIHETLDALQQRADWQRSNGKSYGADKK